MYPPNDNLTQQQQPGMYHPSAQAPYANLSMYSPNDMNQMNAAPPSYDQATQPVPQPSPMPNVVYTTGMQPTNKTVVPFGATQANLEKVSVQTRCNSCCNEIYTRVNDKVSQNGICWAVLCFFCGWMGLKCTVIFARSVTPSLENTAQKCLEGLLLFWSFFLLYALHYKFLA